MYYNKKTGKKRLILTIVSIIAIISAIVFIINKISHRGDDSILRGNGRIEGREIAVATKFSGRIIELNADEGDTVEEGQLLAVIDSRSLAANIEAQKAQADQIMSQISAAEADIAATRSDIKFYKTEVGRSKTLIKQNFSSQLELDKNTNNLEKSEARLLNLSANVKALKASHRSLIENIRAQEIDLGDMNIYAPSNGVILYKLVENGEMLGQNGKLFIMYNPDELYMTIYMPSEKAGQVNLGEEAIIRLDAYRDRLIPAVVTFLPENAEFTPKEVETQKEREKLVFRVKLSLIDNSSRDAKPGMPGDGFVKLNRNIDWPANLRIYK